MKPKRVLREFDNTYNKLNSAYLSLNVLSSLLDDEKYSELGKDIHTHVKTMMRLRNGYKRTSTKRLHSAK